MYPVLLASMCLFAECQTRRRMLALALVALFGSRSCRAITPITQIGALEALYNCTKGENWRWLDETKFGPKWSFTSPQSDPCSDNNTVWQGLKCSKLPSLCKIQTCDIVAISLSNSNLDGSLPGEIFWPLSSITSLQINFSPKLTNSIPSSIGFLFQLRWLMFLDNSLTGALPTTFGSLQELTYLDLRDNHLVGAIPSQFGSLTQLELLYLLDNQLTRSIPTAIGLMLSLRELVIMRNQLTGSVPTELGMLQRLSFLYLSDNRFSSSIPSEIAFLSSLKAFSTYRNYLTGSIPSALGKLSHLTTLEIFNNWLSGQIPFEISLLSSLNTISLSGNSLTGSIPSALGSLSSLKDLYLNSNYLTGVIPSDVGLMTSLSIMLLHNNRFSGSIPSMIGCLSLVQELNLFENHLTGTLSSTLGMMASLRVLSLGNNDLIGSIPPEVGNLSRLKEINLEWNRFIGSLPPSLYNLNSLERLETSHNSITGFLSSEIGSLLRLTILRLYSNYMTGSLPSEFGMLNRLEFVYANDNLFSGSIPSAIGYLSKLAALDGSSNYLTSTVPPEVRSCDTLQILHLHHNHLTGPIPSSFANMTRLYALHLYHNHLNGHFIFPITLMESLVQFLVQQNHFSGNLDMLVPGNSTVSNLVNFDVSDNLLSGSIPSSLFFFPFVESVSLSLNCFQSQLPSSMCESESLTVISMDGLTAAEGCRGSTTMLFESVGIGRTLDGTLPECLWLMSNLMILNLAGNGLRGRISDCSNMTSLRRMTLSHNYLSGVIPIWLQEKNLTQLDLSHNKFTGEITLLKGQTSAQVANTSIFDSSKQVCNWSKSLKLSVNRLSGDLSTAINRYESLDVLSGNLFNCRYTPPNDKNSEWTTCGSNEFDQALFLMTAVLGTVIMLLIILCSFSYLEFSRQDKVALQWLNKYLNYARSGIHREFKNFPAVISFTSFLANSIKLICLVTLVSLVFSLPIYILKQVDGDISTHSHTYNWGWTLAYMSGSIPALLILLMTFLCLLVFCGALHIVSAQSSPVSISGSLTGLNVDVLKGGTEMLWVVIISDIIIVGTMNGLYLWSTLVDFSRKTRTLIQVGFGFFSFIWGVIIIRKSLSSAIKESADGLKCSISLSLINNVIIPGLMTSLSSPSCYQRLLLPPDKISSSYIYRECLLYGTVSSNVICLFEYPTRMATLSVLPPFSYSYQCGSTLLTNYIPVYIYSVSLQNIVFLAQLAFIYYSNYISYPVWLMKKFPGIFWPSFWPYPCDMSDHARMIRPYQIISFIANNCIILLSFGICSPVLGCYISLSVCCNLSCWMILIARFVFLRLEGLGRYLADRVVSDTEHIVWEHKDFYLCRLHHQLHNVQQSIMVSKWPVACTSTLFMMLLCWDMVGDQVGWYAGLWVPITGAGMIILIWIWDRLIGRFHTSRSHPPDFQATDVELVISSLHLAE